MAVDDLWMKGPKGARVRSARYGRGKRYRVRFVDPDGNERQPLFGKKIDAENFYIQVRSELRDGEYVDAKAGKETFRAYAANWQANQVHRETTRLQVAGHLRRHVFPYFRDKSIAAIRASDVQGLVSHLTASLAPATIEVIYRYVAAIFRAAVKDGARKSSPCMDISRPKINPKRVRPMPVAAVRELRAATHRRYRALVDVGAQAGLRHGEAIALEVEHVDFLRRKLRVEQQLVQLPGEYVYLAPPKTEASRRTIPIGRALVARLAAHLAEFPAVEVEVVDKTGPKPITRMARLIFTTDEARPIRRTGYSARVWRPAVKAAGLNGADEPTYHDLRHFYASLLIEDGRSTRSVQERLGHASAAETLRTYSHLWPDDDDRTRDAVDRVLGEDAA